MFKLELIEIDGEPGFVVPAETIDAMSLKEGSQIIAVWILAASF